MQNPILSVDTSNPTPTTQHSQPVVAYVTPPVKFPPFNGSVDDVDRYVTRLTKDYSTIRPLYHSDRQLVLSAMTEWTGEKTKLFIDELYSETLIYNNAMNSFEDFILAIKKKFVSKTKELDLAKKYKFLTQANSNITQYITEFNTLADKLEKNPFDKTTFWDFVAGLNDAATHAAVMRAPQRVRDQNDLKSLQDYLATDHQVTKDLKQTSTASTNPSLPMPMHTSSHVSSPMEIDKMDIQGSKYVTMDMMQSMLTAAISNRQPQSLTAATSNRQPPHGNTHNGHAQASHGQGTRTYPPEKFDEHGNHIRSVGGPLRRYEKILRDKLGLCYPRGHKVCPSDCPAYVTPKEPTKKVDF